MRPAKATFCFLLVLAFCLSCLSVSAAAGNGADSSGDWDTLAEEFLAEHGVDGSRVALGYRNTVTGEEHFWNGDTYFVAASLYKVPLNMVYTERIANGEMDAGDRISGVPYERLLRYTVVLSENTSAELLIQNLGKYQTYRRIIAPYMGEDPDTVGRMFYKNNYFTARQMIHCLNLLETESERFPGLIDAMLEAEPEDYFNHHPQSCAVAHKYGILESASYHYMNDSAIVYTEEPIVIVAFTDGISKAKDFLADYCTLMIEYTGRSIEQRRAEEAAAAEASATPAPSPTLSPSPTLPPPDNASGGGETARSAPWGYVAAAGVLVLGLAVLLRRRS